MNVQFIICVTLAVLGTGLGWGQSQTEPINNWKPIAGGLKTEWSSFVTVTNALPEYPRPQMARPDWMNLNGLWDFALTSTNGSKPERYSRRILVPFPPESSLSGVGLPVRREQQLWYRRNFELPDAWAKKRFLLHCGAIDFEARIWINGRQVSHHRGGYDAFSVDVTEAVNANGTNEIVISAWDPTDSGPYPRGKQATHSKGGIYYTATSGIWQTVWLEPVQEAFVESLQITPDIDSRKIVVTALGSTTTGEMGVEVQVLSQGVGLSRATGKPGEAISAPIPDAKLWTPEDPFCYDLKVTLKRGNEVLDQVSSYFGMRKISVGKDKDGRVRFLLNNQPYFLLGLLDQGFWPESLYTAPADEALRFDIDIARRLGFNTLRKHVKVEPSRWYYWADRLGMLVVQDMPSGDISTQRNNDEKRAPASAEQFELELTRMIRGLQNHPSVVLWAVFNEGWGQYETPRLVQHVRGLDASRLVLGASGWVDKPVGDVKSHHQYPGPGTPTFEEKRATIVGEFGGVGLHTPGHTWSAATWGHREVNTPAGLLSKYTGMMEAVSRLKAEGLSGTIYTQLTDVESEGNGLLTYDRASLKINAQDIIVANQKITSDNAAVHTSPDRNEK